tara:strand:- start:235 stop:465 length:231 start_codon:yes stop_codon:yes gene_type:complete
MNKRIKQLSEQAEKYADENFRGEPTWSEAFESKFAELIILECATLVDAAFDIDEHSGEVVSYADGGQLKEHFGIEK